jgi:hypothetical protein
LPKLEEGSSAAAFSMENVLAEVEDLLSYCNDILCTGSSLHSKECHRIAVPHLLDSPACLTQLHCSREMLLCKMYGYQSNSNAAADDLQARHS